MLEWIFSPQCTRMVTSEWRWQYCESMGMGSDEWLKPWKRLNTGTLGQYLVCSEEYSVFDSRLLRVVSLYLWKHEVSEHDCAIHFSLSFVDNSAACFEELCTMNNNTRATKIFQERETDFCLRWKWIFQRREAHSEDTENEASLLSSSWTEQQAIFFTHRLCTCRRVLVFPSFLGSLTTTANNMMLLTSKPFKILYSFRS